MFCKNCGADNSSDAKFCLKCGTIFPKKTAFFIPTKDIFETEPAQEVLQSTPPAPIEEPIVEAPAEQAIEPAPMPIATPNDNLTVELFSKSTEIDKNDTMVFTPAADDSASVQTERPSQQTQPFEPVAVPQQTQMFEPVVFPQQTQPFEPVAVPQQTQPFEPVVLPKQMQTFEPVAVSQQTQLFEPAMPPQQTQGASQQSRRLEPSMSSQQASRTNPAAPNQPVQRRQQAKPPVTSTKPPIYAAATAAPKSSKSEKKASKIALILLIVVTLLVGVFAALYFTGVIDSLFQSEESVKQENISGYYVLKSANIHGEALTDDALSCNGYALFLQLNEDGSALFFNGTALIDCTYKNVR